MTPIQRTQYYNSMLQKYVDDRRVYLKAMGEKKRVEDRLFNQRIEENRRVESLRSKDPLRGNHIDKMV